MTRRYRILKILSVFIISLATVLLAASRAGIPISDDNIHFENSAATPAAVPLYERQMPSIHDPGVSISIPEALISGDSNDKVITSIEGWKHPVKDVLVKNNIAVLGLELLKDGVYPIFYVTFPHPLHTEFENYFNGVIQEVAKANSYQDFELIDYSRDMRIMVSCDKQFDMVDDITINGDRNYFVRLSQKAAVEKYKYIQPIAINKSSKLPGLMVANEWRLDAMVNELGKEDSYFNRYHIYFDKGISLSYSYDKVYNIVFNRKYTGNVIYDIGLKSNKEHIVKALGVPHFESDEDQMFGYKTKDFYIFFVGEEDLREISVYRRDTGYKKDTLKNIIKSYSDKPDETDAYMLVERILKKWPDCDLHYSERGGVGVCYDSVGVNINNQYEDRGGPYITVYGNFEGDLDDEVSLPGEIDKLKEFSNNVVLLQLDTDSIFASEQRRLLQARSIDERVKQGGLLSPDGTIIVMDNDGGTYEHAGLYICYVNKNKPDKEIFTSHFVGKTIWLDSRYFIYDVYMSGIFVFDTLKNEKLDVAVSELDLGTDYELTSAENGEISYKNLSDGSSFSKSYLFNEEGTIVIK